MNEQDARKHFIKFTRSSGLRVTPERIEVLDCVLAWEGHFEADSLFLHLKTHGSKVSRATVYNTLSLLHKCGIVSRYRFSEGYSQYERTAGRPHHDHMICTQCGKIIEFENRRVVRLQDVLCTAQKFKPTYHSFQIFGVCSGCRGEND